MQHEKLYNYASIVLQPIGDCIQRSYFFIVQCMIWDNAGIKLDFQS
jgi:hypothetical protein